MSLVNDGVLTLQLVGALAWDGACVLYDAARKIACLVRMCSDFLYGLFIFFSNFVVGLLQVTCQSL